MFTWSNTLWGWVKFWSNKQKETKFRHKKQARSIIHIIFGKKKRKEKNNVVTNKKTRDPIPCVGRTRFNDQEGAVAEIGCLCCCCIIRMEEQRKQLNFK